MLQPETVKEFKCWNCGKEKTLLDIMMDKLVLRGVIKEAPLYASRIEVTPLIPPQTAGLTVPTMLKYWDICENCGVEYIKRVDTVDAPITMQQQSGRQPYGPSSTGFPFNKG